MFSTHLVFQVSYSKIPVTTDWYFQVSYWLIPVTYFIPVQVQYRKGLKIVEYSGFNRSFSSKTKFGRSFGSKARFGRNQFKQENSAEVSAR